MPNNLALSDVYLFERLRNSTTPICRLTRIFKRLSGQIIDHHSTRTKLTRSWLSNCACSTKTSNQLIYTILRPLSIPIPMVSNVEMGGNPVPIQSGTLGSNSYDVNFNCKVIFQLKNDIAESIQYEGKAC